MTFLVCKKMQRPAVCRGCDLAWDSMCLLKAAPTKRRGGRRGKGRSQSKGMVANSAGRTEK